MEPYIVIVLKNPTKKAVDEVGEVPVIVVQPTAVMAKDEKTAAMKASRLVPEEHAKQEDLLEVRVLPFRTVVTTRLL